MFSSDSERSSLIKKNIFGSFVLRGVNILISFFLVPLTIGFVTNEIYGVWLTIFSIVHWIGLFDIGFGNGLRNRITESVAIGDYGLAKKYISTTYACLSIIFLPLGVILFFVCPYINWPGLLNVSPELNLDIIHSMQIVILFFCLTCILKIQNTVLYSMQQNALGSLFETFGQLLVLITIFVLTKTTEGSLVKLSLVLNLCPIIIYFLTYWWIFYRKYPKLKPSFSSIQLRLAKDILSLGVKFFIIQIAVVVLYGSINVIISHVSGPENVTEYNVVYKYLSIPNMAFGIMIAPLWSAYTDAYTKNDFAWMKNVYNKMFRLMLILLGVLLVLVSLYPVFFHLWLGDKVEIHFSMILVVAVYMFTMIWNSLHSYIINGIGKIELQLYTSIICTIVNIPLALYLGGIWGAEGVVASTCFLNLIPLLALTIQVRKILNNKAIGIWNK